MNTCWILTFTTTQEQPTTFLAFPSESILHNCIEVTNQLERITIQFCQLYYHNFRLNKQCEPNNDNMTPSKKTETKPQKMRETNIIGILHLSLNAWE